MLQQRNRTWLRRLMVVSSILFISACGDEDSPAGIPVASPAPATTPTFVAAPPTVSTGHHENQVSAMLNEMQEKAARHPTSGDIRGELAMAYEVNGFQDAALTTYQQAEHLAPGDARWPYFQARLLMKQVAPEAALGKLAQVLALAPDHVPSLMWQGTWLFDLGHLQQAEAAFRKAKQHGAGWAADASLARILLRQQRPDEAVALLEALVEKSPFPSVFGVLGQAYRDSGDFDRARIALARGRNAQNIGWLDPWEDLKAPYRISFEARLRNAQTLIRRGRIAESISLLEQLQTTQPDNAVVLTTLSNAFVLNGEQQRGFWVLRRALERGPVHYSIHMNIAGFYQSRGDSETALQHLNKSIELHPDAAEPYFRKATLLRQLGENEKALASFNLSLARDATKPQRFIDTGDIHQVLNDVPNALTRYQQAVDIDPSYLPGYLKLARLLIQTQNTDDAREVLIQARMLGRQADQIDALFTRLNSS